MSSKRTRTRHNRRDRRKAKQSEWTREGRGNPKKVGHGGSGPTQNSSYNPSIPKGKKKKKKRKSSKSTTINIHHLRETRNKKQSQTDNELKKAVFEYIVFNKTVDESS